MQPVTVPRIPRKSGLEHHHPGTVSCILLGGQTQAATIAMSFEIAAVHAAQLTAIAPIDPLASPARSTFSQTLWSLVEDADFAAMPASVKSAIEQFDTHGCADGLRISRVVGGPGVGELTAKAAESDLVLVPANVEVDGSWAEVWSEVAEFMARRGCVPMLRVSRKPLDVRTVVLLVSSTERCSGLAHKYLKLGLWPDARISILPIGDYRPRVSESVREQLGLLLTEGRDAVLLPPIDLDFEGAVLEQILSPFQAAVVGHLSYRAGWFDSIRSDPFEIVASCVPVVLVP